MHPHSEILHLDYNGKLQMEPSSSIAGYGNVIFTEDVADKFMESRCPKLKHDSVLGSGQEDSHLKQKLSFTNLGCGKTCSLNKCPIVARLVLVALAIGGIDTWQAIRA